MKKTSKASGKACQSSQEECGVWLDTVTLKGKAKQMQPARRPISKLLNPSLGGLGYSLAVALNFTQTKVPMPNTKQSSISSFFTPQSRVQNKRVPTEPANRDVVNSTTPFSSSSFSFSSSSTSPSPVEVGAKRTHEPDPEVPAFLYGDEFRDRRRPSERSAPPAGTQRCSREYPGRPSEPSPRTESPSGAQRCSTQEDPGATESCSQYSHSMQVPTAARNSRIQYDLSSQDSPEAGLFSLTREDRPTARGEKESVSGTAPLESLKSEGVFGVCEDAGRFTQEERGGGEERRSTQKGEGGGGVEGRTCTQKPHGYREEEKENVSSSPSALKSPNERSPLSPPRRPLGNHALTQPTSWSAPGPRKRAREDDANGSGLASPCKQTRARSSPLKRAPWRQGELDDSLAMLFTQDSEGFRVIAHRLGGGGGVRSPLKEHSHPSLKTSEEEEEEEEEEMLFTQDSQGNMVIKH